MRQPKNPTAIYDDHRWLVVEGHASYVVYLMNGCATKPYLSMMTAASGRNLIADCPADHLHHHGVWWGHGDVDGVTFYLELPSENPGWIMHRSWLEHIRTDRQLGFRESLDWVAPSGETLIREERRLSVRFGLAQGYGIDVSLTLFPSRELRLGTTKESGMPLIRLADSFNGRAGGIIVDSEGRSGEATTFGQRSRWVDYHAPVPPAYGSHGREGLACFDHPANPDFPNAWFTREYGPLSPREGNHFIGETILRPGSPLRLRHLLYSHVGDEKAGDVESVYQRFATDSWEA
ncbi:hypothetical protein FJZ36_03310 [Candidatus Poribacteria bacterium]|nr:hypothetical protein [Candidatus Poribacteria bacterium]